VQLGVEHAAAVDPRAVRAAVVEDPHAAAPLHDDRVAARDARILQLDRRREAAAEVRDLTRERDR
jgi:hypothetical protein